jgi:hypothetical protein
VATIPVVGTRWRSKDSGEVVEVEHVGYSTFGGWVLVAAPVNEDGLRVGTGHRRVQAKAHWFTTEGYEHVPA